MKDLDQHPKTIYLKDYKEPDFLIEKVELTFDLGEKNTDVICSLQIKKNESSDAGSLVLLGEDLQLKQVKLDGVTLGDSAYKLSDTDLTIFDVPDTFVLETEVVIKPQENFSLEGLYKSSGNFCTQCEAEGFRKITYFLDRPDVMALFTTTIIADKNKYPVLLSNGNPVEAGELDGSRHWAKWHDPFKKPCYLFALVAGDLSYICLLYTSDAADECVNG